jgi:chorismate mutase/GNAT superfamily N-acetyltransferase
MLTDDVELRPAGAADLPAIAALYLRVREAAVPSMPPNIHSDPEVREYVGSWQLDVREVWVAESAGTLLGFASVQGDWLDGLYVTPDAAGQGIGSALLDVVKGLRPRGFCLWVFESNRSARTFYDHRGLVALERTDGSGNEEHSPDVKMAWPGADPLAFFRSLIDEVDEQLGDLFARRVALTRAVQAHKEEASRDPDREAEIAVTMARHAPELGPERLARIMQAVITESLDAVRE